MILNILKIMSGKDTFLSTAKLRICLFIYLFIYLFILRARSGTEIIYLLSHYFLKWRLQIYSIGPGTSLIQA